MIPRVKHTKHHETIIMKPFQHLLSSEIDRKSDTSKKAKLKGGCEPLQAKAR